jgi:hypothetical protein
MCRGTPSDASSELMKLSHIHAFLLGWVYYLVIPVIAAHFRIFDAIESMQFWLSYVSLESSLLWALPLYTALMPAAFVVGDRLSKIIVRVRLHCGPVSFASWLLLPIYASLLVIFTLDARNMLFIGYSEGIDSSTVGPIATVQMALLFQYLLCKAAQLKVTGIISGFLLVCSSIILMGMGGRLYVASSLVALYFYFWLWGANTAALRRRSLALAFLVPVALTTIGMWRVGRLDFSVFGYYLFSESFFTSISAFTIMQGGKWSWIDIDTPKDFFLAFLNIVPSSLWPDKLSVLVVLTDSNLDIESPLGAISVVASTVGNFGFLGGLIFIGFVGYIMGVAKRNARTPITKTFYCYLVSLLPFLFFRDPFANQFKLVITGFILVWLYQLLSLLTIGVLPIRFTRSPAQANRG